MVYEGKPILPDAGVIWRICDKYNIEGLFVAPTTVREMKRVDSEGTKILDHDISNWLEKLPDHLQK